jgi:hypothetical protein
MNEHPTAAPAPPFFVIGSARSGTTMLRMILNAHRDVAVPPESRFIVELWRGERVIDVERWLRDLDAHRRFRAWELPLKAVRAELGDAATVAYEDAVAATYRAYAAARGKKRWGDKTPRHIEHIPMLARLFPDARFVHVVRDGRNVALSYADVPFGPKTVAKAAELWGARVRRGMEDGRALGAERYAELRYEDLVSDEDALRRRMIELCRFLALDFVEDLLDYGERSRGEALARARRYNPHVLEKPISRTRSWERDMAPRDVEVFELVAGPVLSELGYERRFAHPGRAAALRAALGRAGLPVGHLGRGSRS